MAGQKIDIYRNKYYFLLTARSLNKPYPLWVGPPKIGEIKKGGSAMEQNEKGLFVTIENAAPELDFLFALARRQKVSITISVDGVEQDINVYIDSLAVPEGVRVHPELLTMPRSAFDVWFIEGHFWGDGKSTWSQIGLKPRKDVTDQRYYVWGPFTATYKKSRKGQMCILNFIKHEDFRVPKQ